jgi:L-lactate dehydrogenase complex protein LldF
VHVALMGIEKVVPRFEDLEVFLKLLPRSASGQKLTASVSLLTGVKGDASEEGPEEFHVVIIDNGRVEILANPELRESLYCIRCGACLNTCPVYQKIGGHAYGWVYPGPIGAVLTPQLIGRERAPHLPFASSLCGACREACPIKINIPEMLLHLRHEIKEGSSVSSARGGIVGASHRETGARTAGLKRRLGGLFERAAFKLWAAAMVDAKRYRRAGRLARIVQRIFGRRDAAGVYTLPVARWARTRQLPPLAPRSFSSRWPELSKPAGREPGQ